MKKNCIFMLIIFAMMIFLVDKVNAQCDNRTQLEVNTAASNVTMNYTMHSVVTDLNFNVQPNMSPDEVETGENAQYLIVDKVNLQIENVTDKIYVVLQNDDGGINTEYHYSDLKNGTLTYEVPDTVTIRTYKLTIYSDVSDCIGEELRTIEVKTPRYNPIYMECPDSDEYYCQPYITTEINENDIPDNIKYQTPNEEENSKNKVDIKKSNHLLGISIVIILIIAIVIVVIYNKKNKDNFMKSIGGNER